MNPARAGRKEAMRAMTTKRRKLTRDVERVYPARAWVAKLRSLADCIEQGRPYRIQVAGERIYIPADAVISVEHERGSGQEELEFQLKWPVRRRGAAWQQTGGK